MFIDEKHLDIGFGLSVLALITRKNLSTGN